MLDGDRSVHGALDGQPAAGQAVTPGRLQYEASHDEREQHGRVPCPVCGFPIGAVRGSKAAICTNCGFKDGCC